MTLSTLQKSFVSSFCVTSALFAATTVPLAMLRSQPVEVQVKNQAVFASELSDLTGPYLGVAGAFSLALGAGILGMSGWRLAASKSEDEKTKASELQRDLLAYQTELERIKFSDARLKAQDLGAFLEAQPTVDQATSAPAYTLSTVSAPEPVLVNQSQSFGSRSVSSDRRPLAAVPRTFNQETSASRQGHSLGLTAVSDQELVLQRLQDLTAQVMANQAARAMSEEPRFASVNKARMTNVQPQSYQSEAVEQAANQAERAAEGQFDQLLHQLRELATQVEDLRSASSSQVAA